MKDFLLEKLDFNSIKKDKLFFTELFETMPDSIAKTCVVSTVESDTIFFRAGDIINTVYILLSGTVNITIELANGLVYSFAKVDAPAFLGETETFADFSCYRATVNSYTRCHYIALPKLQFITWMKSSNDALFTITKLITQKIACQSTKDRTFLFSSGEHRLAYQMTQYYQINAKNDLCIIKVPRHRLADEIRVSVKTVNRCVSNLKEKKLITQDGQTIQITKVQFNKLLEYLQNADTR